MDDIPYDDEFFENNYNDSYNFKNMKSIIRKKK